MKLDPVREAHDNPRYYRSGYPDMLDDEELVLVTPEDYARLPVYEASRPTGICPGKIWRAGPNVLGAYIFAPDGSSWDDGYYGTSYRTMVIIK